jgi:hypothetical protein
MSARISFGLISLFAAALITLTPRTVRAQATPYCGPIDVVFAIDDTASMFTELVSAEPGAFKPRLTAILDRIQQCSDRDPVNNTYQYRLALVTFKDDVRVLANFEPNNRAAVEPLIRALAGLGGNREADASDEAVNTIVNTLPAAGRLGPDGTQRQFGDFSPAFRPDALKIVVLFTDDPPGGFYDNNDAARDADAMLRADQAAAAGIRIVSVFTPETPTQDNAFDVMKYYADATHATPEDRLLAFVDTVVPRAGDGILTYLQALPVLNRPPVAKCATVVVYGPDNSCNPIPESSASIDFGSYDPDGTVATRVQAPPGPYAPGITPVTLTVTDNQGGTDSCTAEVDVWGCEPTIHVPMPLFVEATGPAGAVVTFEVTATDYTGVPVTPVLCVPPSGSTLPIATTLVNCEAIDSRGVKGTSWFNVTVEDRTPPVVSLTSPAAGPVTGIVTLRATATDAVGVKQVQFTAGSTPLAIDTTLPYEASWDTSGLADGTVVTLRAVATDTFDNASAEASVGVTVAHPDTVPPVVTITAPATVEATGPAGAVVTYTATATDDKDPAPVITCTPPSGSVFSLGPTTIRCTARDAAGNVSTEATALVTVRDTTPPTLTLPPPVSVETEDPTGAPVTYGAATAADLVDLAPVVACTPPSGSHFVVGPTTVTCTARDAAGNQSSGTVTVTVTLVDTTPPVVTVPEGPTLEAIGADGAPFTFTATAVDNVDGPLTPTCTPASGAMFPLGPTTVTCSATDSHANTGSASFIVTVQDTTAPELIVPPQVTATATTNEGATVTFTVTASDLVDGVVLPACTPASGALFPIGTTTVTCTAADSRANAATATFPVIVTLVDTTPPAMTCVPNPQVLWPPNDRLVPIHVSVTLSDAGSGPAGFVLVAAFSNQGSAGDMTGFVLMTPDVDGFLRAKRTNSSDTRIYSLVYEGRDGAGNTAQCAATVTVPHDNRQSSRDRQTAHEKSDGRERSSKARGQADDHDRKNTAVSKQVGRKTADGKGA